MSANNATLMIIAINLILHSTLITATLQCYFIILRKGQIEHWGRLDININNNNLSILSGKIERHIKVVQFKSSAMIYGDHKIERNSRTGEWML